MKGKSRIITLELSRVEGAAEKPVGEMGGAELWGVYFRYLTDKSRREKINELIAYDEGIAMASEVLLSISRDDAERARLASEYKYAVDTQSKVVQAKREGMQEGEKKGEKNKAIETARKMKADNMPVSLVVKYTGLTDQQVEDL